MTAPSFRPRFLGLLRRVLRAREGNVAVLFGLAAVPLLGVAGVALDYVAATQARAQAQVAVDAAALAGAKLLNRSDGEVRQAVASVFQTKAPASLRATQPSVTIDQDRASLTVDATGQSETSLLKVIGITAVSYGVSSQAARPNKRYIDIYLALDVSASMGLAADETGRDRLRALTNPSCAFACHDPEGGQTVSNYTVAKTNDIQTRFDVLQAQTHKLAQDLLGSSGASDSNLRNEVRFALYTVADTAGRALAPPSGSASLVDNAINQLQLAYNTQFDQALPVILQDMGSQGTGSDSLSPLKLMLLVTDGVQSFRSQPWESNYFRPIDVSLCDAVKAKGFQVAVLNIRYVPMPTEAPYNGTVGRFQTQLAPNLRACASPNMYYEAERPDEIEAGFRQFAASLSAYRLTR